jgi:hypothetical protein
MVQVSKRIISKKNDGPMKREPKGVFDTSIPDVLTVDP